MLASEMSQLKTTILLQFLFYIIVCTQALPVTQDQHYSLYTSKWYKKPQFKINSMMPGLFLQDFGKHRFNCGERCAKNTIISEPPPMKKDVFMSRSWSAGGMPFSVLYMNPKHPKNTRSPIAQPLQLQQDFEEKPKQIIHNIEEEQQNIEGYELPEGLQPQALTGVRSGGGVSLLPSRRQYSIIPQLFVSYGWGPLGK